MVEELSLNSGSNNEVLKSACIRAARELSDRDVIGFIRFGGAHSAIGNFLGPDKFESEVTSGNTRADPSVSTLKRALEQAKRMYSEMPGVQTHSPKHILLVATGEAQTCPLGRCPTRGCVAAGDQHAGAPAVGGEFLLIG